MLESPGTCDFVSIKKIRNFMENIFIWQKPRALKKRLSLTDFRDPTQA